MQASTDVLIVGAGPVGLTVAAELQRRGIDHLIIDQRPRPEYYCKALGITPRTLEVWDQMGLLEDALRHGCFLQGVTGAVNGEDTGTELVPTDTMPYGFLSLAQYDTEEMMRRQLSRYGGRVHQGVALSSVASATDGSVARVHGGDAERTVECRYLGRLRRRPQHGAQATRPGVSGRRLCDDLHAR
jgi:2-polyprenyl-6-methoxyphenol hydroxylase-like FAD-dependent oxidoreductase